MKLDLYYGTVVSLSDPDNLGRIQVRILPELSESAEADLPWVGAFTSITNGDGKSFSHSPPAKGSPVWTVFTDDYLQVGFYLGGPTLDNSFDFSAIASALGAIPSLSSQEVEKTEFRRFSDGTITFNNPVTKEFGILHSTGSFSLIRADGTIEAYSKAQIKFANDNGSFALAADGNIYLTGPSLKFKNAMTGATIDDYLVTFTKLKSVLNTIFTYMSTMMMVDPLSGSTGAVMPAIAIDLMFPTLKVPGGDVDQIKSGT